MNKNLYSFVHGHNHICVVAPDERSARHKLLYHLENQNTRKTLAKEGWILYETLVQSATTNDVYVRA